MNALLLLTLQLVAPADTTPKWRGDFSVGTDLHDQDRARWTLARASLGVRAGRRGLAADLWTASRFSVTDQGGGVDLFLPLGRRSSLYLRGAAAPEAEIAPEREGVIEIASSLRGGWEGSVRYRTSAYDARDVNALTVGAGRWKDRWYFRFLATRIESEGEHGGGVGIRVRRYLDPRRPESSLDLFADLGREVVTLGPLVPPDLRNTSSLGLRWQRPLDRRTGLSFTFYRNTEAEAPSRIGLGVGGYRTW